SSSASASWSPLSTEETVAPNPLNALWACPRGQNIAMAMSETKITAIHFEPTGSIALPRFSI
ncbi:MAG: hypothetical protein ACPL7J_11080, partial [Desulfomonilaceae bacterium]